MKDRTGFTSQLIRLQMLIECGTEFVTSKGFCKRRVWESRPVMPPSHRDAFRDSENEMNEED